MDNNNIKSKLRVELLAKRDALSIDLKQKYDKVLNEKLIKEILFNSINTMHIYLPMRSEVNLYPVIEYAIDNDIKVVCPKSLKNGMLENRILGSMKDIEKGIFGTSHPTGPVFKGGYDLIVVPGLAFTLENDRLGYGGGYYDRFLTQHAKVLKISLAYPFQILNELPTEVHDIKVDRIILP